MVAAQDSTLSMIKTKIRRLTASPSESSLASSIIEEYINTFYLQDFPYGVKTDQLKTVHKILTQVDIDIYDVDIDSLQSFRTPVYIEGVPGLLYKDRQQFFNVYPRLPTLFTPATGDGLSTAFSFTITGPFLRESITIGTKNVAGVDIQVTDTPNAGLTTGTLFDSNGNNVGNVNYVTGLFNITFVNAPGNAEVINVWGAQYQRGRPYSVLFWNNRITVRPVPDKVYKIEIEAYLTPSQFIAENQDPIVNQWWQYIAYGAAIKILQDRQDMDGVNNLMPEFQRQEALVLERQANNEIGQRNVTIFAGSGLNQYRYWWYY